MSKYGARKTMYRGLKFDSAAEAKHAMELDIRKSAGEIEDWMRQIPIHIEVNGVKICKMVLDFKVWDTQHKFHYEEVKGVETAVYKLKLKLLKALYPDINLLVVNV